MYFKLHGRRFILLGIWLFLMSLLIFIWFINYFIINILLYCIIFIVCAGVLLIKIINSFKISIDCIHLPLFFIIPFIIIWFVWYFYDFIIFNIIFVICDLIIVIKIY